MVKKSNKNSDIEKRVTQIISEQTGIPENKIKPNSDLREDLGIDSFAAIELAFNLKSEFGVAVEENELPNLHTVEDLIVGIKKKA